MRLEITLIGDVAVRGADGDAGRSLAGANPRAALALLALERVQGVTRERLAEVLWPDRLPATWDSALRMVVTRVRSFLRSVLPPGAPDPIVAERGRYRLRLPDDVEVDVDVEDAEQALAEAGRALVSGDPVEARRRADHAVSRLRGPFLPGRHGGWVDEQRDRLSVRLVAALEEVSRAAVADDDPRAALAAADEAVQRAPLRETAHRARMAAHAAAGNRGEALRAYQRLRRVLAEELGVDPDAETEAAYLELLGPAPPSRPSRPAQAVRQGPSAGPDPSPFVGREGELAQLGVAWDRAAAGARHLVVVTGEAGIGKTRLVTEAARRVSGEGALVLFGRCDEEAIVPYQPIVEALDGLVSAIPADELAMLDDEARAELAAVLPSLDAPRRMTRPAGPAGLFEAVTTLVASVARERPVLLVLDDLQWADRDTLLLVRHLLRRAGEAPVLVVAISRDHDVASGHVLGDVVHALERDGWVRRLPLRGLGEPDVRTLLHRAEVAPGDEAALARRLVTETAGNPFLVTELLRGPSVRDPDRPIPPSVHELVAHRLARLDAPTVELLRAGAVAGTRFELDLVAACAGLDEGTMLDALDAALDSGLVTEESPERYRFPHDIVRRTLAAQLSGARRRALQARLADVIETRRAERLDAYAAALAHHRAAAAPPGGDPGAVRWSRVAARQAAEHRALAEAVRLGRQALAHVPADDGGLRAEVVTDLAIDLLAAADPDGDRTLVEGATLAHRHGRSDVLARGALALADRAAERPALRPDATALLEAALEELASRTRTDDLDLLHGRLLARRVSLIGDSAAPTPLVRPPPEALRAVRRRLDCLGGPDLLDERVALALDLAALAEASDDAPSVVVAAHERAMAAAFLGDDDTLESCLSVVEEAATKSDDTFAVAAAAEHEATRAAMTGRFDDALAAIDAAASASEVLQGPGPAAALARRHLAVVAWMRETAPADGELARDLADGFSDNPASDSADGQAAEAALALLVRGDRDRARIVTRDLTSGVRELPAGDGRLHALGVVALVAADLRDPGLVEEVHAWLAPYANLSCGAGYRTFAGVAAFHLGRLAAVAADWAEAERHMLAALRRYSALQARPWLAFTQSVLADVLEARGRPSDREWVATLRAESGWATTALGLRKL